MMRKSFPNTEKVSWRESSSDSYSVGDLDLLNLKINFSSDETRHRQAAGDCYYSAAKLHHPLRNPERRLPNIHNLPQGYGKHLFKNPPSDCIECLQAKSLEHYPPSPISHDDFLFPSKKKKANAILSSPSTERMCKAYSSIEETEGRNFPFKLTPSGNLKVNTNQVIFSSNKFSVLVADPENTKVNIQSPAKSKMTQEPSLEVPKPTAMEAIMSQQFQAGLSSIGSLIGNTPARSTHKEASEYESKQTSEILDPELNLGRLGYNGADAITWDKVKLPEKKNLYLELYSRITNYTNADCKVYIENEEFNCHLIVLQCYSELFDAYIAVKKVELPSDKCSAASFAFIYEWMITGEPSYKELNRDNVLDIFNSAKYLKIKDLVEQCWAFIDNADVFSEDTAFLLYNDAKIKGLPEVRELMLPRVQTFFLMLVSSQDWLELELEDVKNFLKSNYISVNCEMEIFMAAVRWLKYDWHNRDQYKYDVLECVRFGNIAPWQLVDIKRNPENPDFMELAKDARICKMIDDGLAYVIIKYWYGQENDDFQHWNSVLGLSEPPVRNWSGCDKTYFTYREFLIYLDQYRRSQLIEKNKPKSSERKNFLDLAKCPPNPQQEKMSPRVPTMDEFLSKKKDLESSSTSYQDDAATVIQRAYRNYKTEDSKINRKPNKNQILKMFHKTTTVSKFQYKNPEISLFQQEKETVLVFGGIDPYATYGVGRNTGKDIFKYIPEENHWEYVGDLPEPRYYHCVQFFKGRIYLVGGVDPRKNQKHVVDTVWSFEPISRTWYRESNLITPRKHFGLVVSSRNLFAIGGQEREKILKSVEKYNPSEGFWEEVAPMLFSRSGHSSAKYQDLIWVAGGLSGKRKIIIDSVESYNVKTNQWTEITKLNIPKCFSYFQTMQNRIYLIGGARKADGNSKNSISLNTVEVWDSQDRNWRTIAELSVPRHGHSVTCIGTQILIIAGVTTTFKKILSSVECFCCERETWVKGISSLPTALSGHAAVTLPPAMYLA